MAQYDLILVRNDHASGVEFTEVTLAKPSAAGKFLTQDPATGAFSWTTSITGAVLNGTVTGTAIINDLSTTPPANKLLDALTAKNYMDMLIQANDAMVYKGGLDCSANPNYPVGQVGWTWKVTVAGKIGGTSGTPVEVGDTIICSEANSGGTEATVGTKFNIIQGNIDGALYDGLFGSTGLLKRTGTKTYTIVTDSSANWNTAYGWGNHASAGYALNSALTSHIGDSTKHVPANGTTNNKKVLMASATSGVFSWSFIDYADILNTPNVALSGHTHAISDITGLQTALDGKSDVGHTHPLVTTTVDGLMSYQDKVKLNGIATGATANTGTVTSIATSGAITGGTITTSGTISHSTADGYLHVPATSTTNNNKVLKAGATAGSLSWGFVAWGELTGVPSTFTPSAHDHWVAAPASKTATGTAGQMAYDANYLYICVAANTWRRSTLAQW